MPISEIVTGTGRLSPFEDFKKRTLSSIDALWEKFLYVAGLRSHDGRYEHWGHSRVYGDENSQSALAQIHSELYLEVLRTPLRNLTQDWNGGETAEAAITAPKLMVPRDLRGGSPRHLNSVELAVRLLSADRQASTHLTS